MPMTATGKIHKLTLRRQFRDYKLPGHRRPVGQLLLARSAVRLDILELQGLPKKIGLGQSCG
jgi:hypothetical protein